MKLQEYLKQKDVTQTSFASSVGVAQSHINNIIRGKKSPSPKLTKKIEEMTDGKVSFEDLFNPEAPSRLKSKRINNEKKE